MKYFNFQLHLCLPISTANFFAQSQTYGVRYLQKAASSTEVGTSAPNYVAKLQEIMHMDSYRAIYLRIGTARNMSECMHLIARDSHSL